MVLRSVVRVVMGWDGASASTQGVVHVARCVFVAGFRSRLQPDYAWTWLHRRHAQEPSLHSPAAACFVHRHVLLIICNRNPVVLTGVSIACRRLSERSKEVGVTGSIISRREEG